MNSEEKKLRIFEAVIASNLDPGYKLPFIKWGEKQIAEDASAAQGPEKIEVTNTAAPHTIEQAKYIVDLARELRFEVEAQAMDSHTIEQIEIRKKRVADLRNELTSLGVAIPSDPSAAPAI